MSSRTHECRKCGKEWNCDGCEDGNHLTICSECGHSILTPIPPFYPVEKTLVMEGKILSKPREGIYSVTRWYSDGSTETFESPQGVIIIPSGTIL
jgi:hypothetical protein